MAAVVVIDGGHDLTVEARCINQPNKSKLSLYKPFLNSSTQAKKRNASVIMVGVVCVGLYVSRHLKEEGLGYR